MVLNMIDLIVSRFNLQEEKESYLLQRKTYFRNIKRFEQKVTSIKTISRHIPSHLPHLGQLLCWEMSLHTHYVNDDILNSTCIVGT